MQAAKTYSYSTWSLIGIALIGLAGSWFYVWKNHINQPVNFIDGDAEYYYYYLQSTFSDVSKLHYDWLRPDTANTISHHPVGLSLLLLPFYLLAWVSAWILGLPADGLSLPFQIAISAAGLVYALMGSYFLKKFLLVQGIPDKVIAILLLLVFLGTTLFQYSIVEPAMSHVYSFCFIALFLYLSSRLAVQASNCIFILAVLTLGIILLIRPNNILILFALPFLFPSSKHFLTSLVQVLRSKIFYSGLLILLLFASFQLLTWYLYEKQIYSNRYAPYGFNWLHPHWKEMLFGFEAGLFIYTPICLYFLLGLIPVIKENRYRFFALFAFILLLFYFFSAYSAYTYFDGLGIRVLVDYYSVFAFAGAKLISALSPGKWLFPALLPAVFFVLLNLVYSYQSSMGILLRAGMNFNKWKYVFMKTGYAYRDCLGGANEYPPYSRVQPSVLLTGQTDLSVPFNYANQEFGVLTHFDSLGIRSNRIHLCIQIARKEAEINSSQNALVCVALEDKRKKEILSYFQFKLNETPSETCCEEREYHYSANMSADIHPNNGLSVYIWNREKRAFEISRFSVQIYNYNYQIK